MATKKKKKSELEEILGGSYNPFPSSKSNNATAPRVADFSGGVTTGKANTRQELTSSNRNDKWFTTGAFGDNKGNIFTDAIDTILGTTADVGIGAVKGIANIGEGIGDLITYGEAQVFDWFGKDDFADNLRSEASRSLTDDFFNPIEDTLAKSSIIGDKGDSISEGLGFVLGTMATGGLASGLGKTGAAAGKIATAATTGQTFLTSMGSSMGEAYRSGATDGEAWAYGTIGGLAEAGTELLFGGLGKSVKAVGLSTGLSSADDMLAKKVSSVFKTTLGKNLAEYGIKAGAEGFEEVASGVIQALGQKLTYASEEEIGRLIEDQNLLEQFITGAVVSGIVQTPGLVSNTKAGQDFVTGNTEVEQKVVDEMVEKRKQELLSTKNEGETLTTKEINKIQEEVQEDFENGRIDTKDIESIVGEDVVNEWNSKNAQLQDLQAEFKAATDETTKKGISSQIKALESEINSNSRIQRSYQEKQNKSQEFVYEATGKESEFAKGVIESTKGKVNNTTRSHETADALIKMSEDRGIQYKFTNNAELQEKGLVPKGKIANGVYEVEVDGKREILVNVDSKKYVESILVHETAHDLKTTDAALFNNLSKATIDYAKAKGDYDTISNEIVEMYKDVDSAKVDEEVTARLLEDYLGNKEFISNLSTKEPGIVKKIIDEIKYLVKKFTAGSPEARKLLELQRNMEDAYKEAYRNTEVKGSVETKTDVEVETIDTKATDNEGRTLTAEQQDFFKNSKVRDDNGNLLTVYHGTKADFNVFENSMAGDNYEGWAYSGKGFYFTDNKTEAQEFGDYSQGEGETKIKEVYLNMENPFDTSQEGTEVLNKIGEEYGIDAHYLQRGDFLLGWFRNNKINASEVLQKYGFDGVIDYGHYMVFDSSQIKNIDNTKPTNNKDIRYSLSDEIEIKTRENMSDVPDNETIEFVDINKLENVISRPNQGGRNEQYISELRQQIRENGITEPLEITINDYGEAILEDGNHRLDIAKENGMKQVPIRIREANNEQTKMIYKKIFELNTDVFNTIQRSLSNQTDTELLSTNNRTAASDIRLQIEELIAPLQETIVDLTNEIKVLKQDPEVKALTEEDIPFIEQMNTNVSDEAPTRNNLTTQESNELDYLEAVEDGLDAEQQQRLAELRNKEAYMYSEDEISPTQSLFETRDYAEVGNQKVKAYQYENPEVKPYFKEEALMMLHDLNNSTKGERMLTGDISQLGNNDYEYTGTKRHTTLEIEQLLDGVDGKLKLSYDEIRQGLNALIEDNGLENNKASKRIEFFIDQRLREGYEDIEGNYYPPNQEYINMLKAKGITEYNQEAYDNWLATLDDNAIESMITNEDASNTEEIAENVRKNEPEYIPQDPTKERTYEDSIKRDPLQDFLEAAVKKNNLNNIKEDKTPAIKKSKFKNLVDTTRTLFVNKYNEIDNLAKDTGNKRLTFKADMLNSVAGEIEGDINVAQTDNNGMRVGKSVRDLFQPSKDAGLYDAFNDYLIQKSNIERHKQNKGSIIPENVSRKLVKEYEQTYPQMKTWAKDVYKYYDNVLNNEVEAGLIKSDLAKLLRGDTMYPSYVPFFPNEVDTDRYFDNGGELKPVKVLKRAVGKAHDIAYVEDSMIKQTYAYKKAVRTNNLYKEIVNTLEKQGLRQDIGGDTRLDPTQLNESLYIDENGNRYLTAYVNGETKSVKISEDLYNSLENGLGEQIKELEQKYSLVTKPLQKLSEIRRNLLTTWSPSFLITNPIKDIQDAIFNSKYTKDMLKNYLPAYKELAQKNNATVQQFLALYGDSSNYGEFDVDSVNKTSKLKNVKMLQRLSAVNNVIELAPRYAEFKASLQNGTSVEEAIYNAKDVTTNFSRGGEITKAMNRNGFTFLNASVQGFDKLYRNFSGENGAKGYAQVLSKAIMVGVAPALLNALLFDDDEEYEVLPDYIKDNYYIFKTGDGEFIRIPKGRVISVFGSAGRRTLEFIQGEEDAFEGYFKNAYSQVGISNPLESNIFAPLIQAYGSEEGQTWYGEDLVPSRLQDLPSEEQYDASTDKVSQFLGELIEGSPLGGVLDGSPYKLNYVLDQYTGGIGDLALPIFTDEASSDGSLLAPLVDKFTADSTTDNKNVGDIYSLSEELSKKSNSSKATDEDTLKSKYIYSVTSEMNKLYAERREVQNDSTLSKAEKYEKSQAIKEQINALAKEGLENYENINKTSNYAIINDREYYKYTDDEGNEKWGTPKEDEIDELNALGMDIKEKSTYFSAKNTISSIKDEYSKLLKDASDDEKDTLYAEQKVKIINEIKNTNLTDNQKYYLYDRYYSSSDTLDVMKKVHIGADAYLDYASQSFTADKNIYGETINGSKKAKVFNYINSMDIDFEQKVILAKMEYNSYDEYNVDIIEYLNNDNSITYEDMESILKKLGFEVDSKGNISW